MPARAMAHARLHVCKGELMNRTFLPFLFLPMHAAARLIGRDRDKVAVLALQAILRSHRTLEVAHQQIRWREHHLAFSSRITSGGELVVEIDVGDPRLEHRLVLENDLRGARRNLKGIAGEGSGRAGRH
jgi:hypothetical protein